MEALIHICLFACSFVFVSVDGDDAAARRAEQQRCKPGLAVGRIAPETTEAWHENRRPGANPRSQHSNCKQQSQDTIKNHHVSMRHKYTQEGGIKQKEQERARERDTIKMHQQDQK